MYNQDPYLFQNRMKPPLTKLRMGELYGDINSELLGHIKSLTYTVPDESPWEIRAGARVPKYVTAAITYQVIHEEQRNRLRPMDMTAVGHHIKDKQRD